MGCGASNANTVSNIRTPAVASSPQPRRAPTAVNTPMASQPVTLPLPFRHGAPITQVRNRCLSMGTSQPPSELNAGVYVCEG